MKKIIRLTESDLTRLVRRVIEEQTFGSTVTPDVVENFWRKNIEDVLGSWTTADDMNKLYTILVPLSGKRVKGVTKCFNEEHQFGNKPIETTVLSYINELNLWSLQDKCSGRPEEGPSYRTLVDEVRAVGTKTLGKEGDLAKKKLMDLFLKNGIKPTKY